MPIRSDFHIHSEFSSDSDAKPEKIIKAALGRDLREICFTEHMDKDYVTHDGDLPFVPDTDAYVRTLTRLREKYKERIDIGIGIEIGLLPRFDASLGEYAAKYPFDFIIGSVHTVMGEDPYYGYLFEKRSLKEAYGLYFEEMLKGVRSFDDFDVLGHIDYVARYGRESLLQSADTGRGADTPYPEKMKPSAAIFGDTSDMSAAAIAGAWDLVDTILKTLIQTGRGIEVNTASLSHGLSYVHPHADILKRYRQLGGEIVTVGSDAHTPNDVAYKFDVAAGTLKECGFSYYTVFKDRKPIFRKLD